MHRFLSLILLCLVLSLTGCKPSGGDQAAAGGGMMGGNMPPAPVTAVKPLQKDVQQWDDVRGRFAAVNQANIQSRVSGYVTGIHFKDGQIVKKGDLLFTIDPKPFVAAEREASANIGLAKTQLTLAERELARAADLLSTGDVSQTFYDQRLQARDQARAQIRAAQARLESVGLDVNYTKIRAPFAGRISRAQVDVGNLIAGDTMGQPTLLTQLVQLSPIHFYFEIDEATYLKYTRLSQSGDRQSSRDVANPIQIALSDETEYTHDGQMDFVDNAIDNHTSTMQGRAILENATGLIAPGMFGRGRILGSDTYSALLIPPEAVSVDQTRNLVMTVMPDGTVVPKPIELGPVIDGLRVVTSGLDGKETIVVKGLQRSIPGMKVAPKIVTFAQLHEAPATP